MIEWTEQAVQQLKHVHDHIALSNSEEVAARITRHVAARVQQLESFAMSGRSSRVACTRELVISDTPFIVAYTIDDERIVVLALYHGAQKWPNSF